MQRLACSILCSCLRPRYCVVMTLAVGAPATTVILVILLQNGNLDLRWIAVNPWMFSSQYLLRFFVLWGVYLQVSGCCAFASDLNWCWLHFAWSGAFEIDWIDQDVLHTHSFTALFDGQCDQWCSVLQKFTPHHPNSTSPEALLRALEDHGDEEVSGEWIIHLRLIWLSWLTGYRGRRFWRQTFSTS